MSDRNRHTFSFLARGFKLSRLIVLSGQYDVFPFYHSVSSHELPHIRHLYALRTPGEFEQDLDEFLRWYEPVSLADYLKDAGEYADRGAEGKTIQEKRKPRMVLSFDDGLAECHALVAPLLMKKGIPAVFFLNNDFIDDRDLFFRYKASILIDRVSTDARTMERMAEYLEIPEAHIVKAIMKVGYAQKPLLDTLAKEVEVDFRQYVKTQPVYMTSSQIMDLVKRGFELGAHGRDHADFSLLDGEAMATRVSQSIKDIQKRFGIHDAYFSFPFTSDGIPKEVLDNLLEQRLADVLFGTAGLKNTGHPRLIQRIPMEVSGLSGPDTLKTEYFYYLVKGLFGRNNYRY
jgi:peptidoglycan/xylan/chitin deacetylase (PgdA/CDA1 family)